eukprot:COSAG01_NODE_1706_length_9427_cov_51.196934_11_plen_112_part_00
MWYYLVETIATDDALVCTARDVAGLVRDPFRPNLFVLTGISLCNVCSCHEIFRRATDRQLPPGSAFLYNFAFPNAPHPGATTNFVGHCTQNAFVFGEQTPCSTNQSAGPLN